MSSCNPSLRALFVACCLPTLLCLWGCGGASRSTEYALEKQSSATSASSVSAEAAESAMGSFVAFQAPEAAAARKIIYNAKIALETSDIDQFSRELTKKLDSLGGFVADFSEQRYAGDRRTGSWTLRIGADKFPELLAWFDGESNVTRKEVTSEDVTEEYVDLAARLENKRNTERRLTAILEERTGKLDEILSIEREIDRVREDIERIEGRLRFLGDRVALSTITLTASTRVEYQAPLEASFGTKIVESWNGSVTDLRETAESFVVVAVSIAPWLPLWLALFGFALWIVRSCWRKLIKLSASLDPPTRTPPITTQPPITGDVSRGP